MTLYKYLLAIIAVFLVCPVGVLAADWKYEPQPAAEEDTQKQASNAGQRAKDLTVRQDDKRPEDQFTVQLFGRPLTIGGEYELKPRYRNNFDLDPEDDYRRFRLDQNFDLELFYEIRHDLFAFLEAKARRRDDWDLAADEHESDSALERGQTWLYAGDMFGTPFSLQIGRQNIREKRGWWWDEDLDSVRVFYHSPSSTLEWELAAAEQIAPLSVREDVDPELDDVRRVLGQLTWHWDRKQRIEFFFLHQNDYSKAPRIDAIVPEVSEDESDAQLTWVGLRALGRWKVKPLGRFYYWFESALVDGKEKLIDFDDAGDGMSIVDEVFDPDVRGWALDIGATWQLHKDRGLAVTFGFAHGSGDADPEDGTDRAFRQSGLHDNKGKFRGVNRFRYYGELTRPELSNLNVYTAAVGSRFWKKSSWELVYHHYQQVEAADFVRDSRIRTRPLGTDRHLGDEIDIVFGFEEWKHLEIDLVGAVFRAGDAYGPNAGERAYNVILQFDYDF